MRDTYLVEYIDFGYDVSFWDLSRLIHPGLHLCDEITHPCLTKYNSLDELRQSITSYHTIDPIYIFDFDPSWKNNQIFILFKKWNCTCIRIDMYANTHLRSSKVSFLRRLQKVISRNGLKLIKGKINRLSYTIYIKYHLKFSFNRFLSSSCYSNRTDCINHPDYDEYIRTRNIKRDAPKHIVFIDTYYGLHPDAKYFYNIKLNINIDEYHNSLKRFFDYVEHQYGLPVVIAAHPKSNYTKKEYGNREIIKYKTLELIKEAKYVIAQVCNTFSWISLENKPVLLLSNNEYLKSPNMRNGLNALSDFFDCKIQNIDNTPYEDIEFKTIREDKRLQYIYSYLTSPVTENKRNIDILNDLINSISSNKKQLSKQFNSI